MSLQYFVSKHYMSEDVYCYGGKLDTTREVCMAGQFASPVIAEYKELRDESLHLTHTQCDGVGLYGFRDSCQVIEVILPKEIIRETFPKGDSGSPVWKWLENKDDEDGIGVFIGLISRGAGCADGRSSVGVVTRVKQHLGWIEDVTKLKGIGIILYIQLCNIVLKIPALQSKGMWCLHLKQWAKLVMQQVFASQ